MKIRGIFYLLVMICLLVTTACAPQMEDIDKPVSEDSVFSSPNPPFKVRIHPELTYLEKFSEGINAHNSRYNRTLHFFGKLDAHNMYQKGVVLEYLSLPSDLVWRGNPHLYSEHTVKSGTMSLGKADAEYIIVPGNPFSEHERAFLTEKGYELPQCSMLKVAAKQRTYARVYIYYFDQAFPCGKKWSDEDIERFMKNSERDMVFE